MMLFQLRRYKEPNKISPGEIISEALNLNTKFKLCNVARIKFVLPDWNFEQLVFMVLVLLSTLLLLSRNGFYSMK